MCITSNWKMIKSLVNIELVSGFTFQIGMSVIQAGVRMIMSNPKTELEQKDRQILVKGCTVVKKWSHN